MQILSLEKLKNITMSDLFSPKIVRFVWSAILDDHVCELCRSLDGKVMDANSPEYSIYKSPIHPRCRCTQIPITSDAEIIPYPNFEKPKDSWIVRYAPFWFLIPFKGKKEQPMEITPFEPKIPEPIFDENAILVIQNNMEITKQKTIDSLIDNIILIIFIGKRGETVTEIEFNEGSFLVFTHREEKLIKEKAVSYIMDNSFDTADEIESEIKKKFGLMNKF